MSKKSGKLQAIELDLKDIQQMIYFFRGRRVMLDSDLAQIYDIPTYRFNEAVKRNLKRFPEDFMFQLTDAEAKVLTSQFAMSKRHGRGGRRTRPFAFTEHGALMAANILNSKCAVAMSVYVIRAFVRLREVFTANQILEKRLDEIEKILTSHDAALRDLYRKIRPLLLPMPVKPKIHIGFHP